MRADESSAACGALGRPGCTVLSTSASRGRGQPVRSGSVVAWRKSLGWLWLRGNIPIRQTLSSNMPDREKALLGDLAALRIGHEKRQLPFALQVKGPHLVRWSLRSGRHCPAYAENLLDLELHIALCAARDIGLPPRLSRKQGNLRTVLGSSHSSRQASASTPRRSTRLSCGAEHCMHCLNRFEQREEAAYDFGKFGSSGRDLKNFATAVALSPPSSASLNLHA